MQKRAERTRARILRSGIRLFSRYGFAAASVDRIAADTGSNKQRIYAYFGSKNGLFTACLQSLFAEVERFSETMLNSAERDPKHLTEILFDGFYGVHEKFPEFRRMLAWANLENSADPDMLVGVRKSENERIRTVFRKAVGKKFLRRTDYRVYLLNVMSLAYFCHSNRRTLEKTIGLPEHEAMKRELAELYGEKA